MYTKGCNTSKNLIQNSQTLFILSSSEALKSICWKSNKYLGLKSTLSLHLTKERYFGSSFIWLKPKQEIIYMTPALSAVSIIRDTHCPPLLFLCQQKIKSSASEGVEGKQRPGYTTYFKLAWNIYEFNLLSTTYFLLVQWDFHYQRTQTWKIPAIFSLVKLSSPCQNDTCMYVCKYKYKYICRYRYRYTSMHTNKRIQQSPIQKWILYRNWNTI